MPFESPALLIANPHATKARRPVIDKVIAAVAGQSWVDIAYTEAKGHAIDMAANAVDKGYRTILALGGDGTFNEVVNGVGDSDIVVAPVPAGSTNVVARSLGYANDPVRAIRVMRNDAHPQRMTVGSMNGRRFVFACGCGLDASVARLVDAHPDWKRRLGALYFTGSAVYGYFREYWQNPVQLSYQADEVGDAGITVIAQNSHPFSYFRGQSVTLAKSASMADPDLAVVAMTELSTYNVPSLLSRVFIERLGAVSHRHVRETEHVQLLRVKGDREFPVQVDGDYVGDFLDVTISTEPDSVNILVPN
ncbi:diacylglycerol/lipid kinase family protein [Smaragdicoccus niigatensis]|uniref:diacylglycerol/lipid kinase family protein n=1 Tax=Smaragdicoccus niigatensis TaxID=359359 RepID=UPI00037F9745|nr:diacylglycerol kinase family protein [Smaragdicoccus niigatensis]